VLRYCSTAVVLACLLASGCCLPALSGRCEQACDCGPSMDVAHDGGLGMHERIHGPLQGHRQAHGDGRYGGAWLHRWPDFGARRGDTPPGEAVPLPKFHPVPTRPVFEPLPEYAPPHALRAHGGGEFAPPDYTAPELVPTPAQPTPDPV